MATLVAGIVSGGQTGADRAAMRVAAELGLPLFGWCPAGRLAEDGPLPPHWPLRETPSADPAQRTSWNAFDADATLVLADGAARGGTALAADVARRFGRPLRVVPPDDPHLDEVRAWLRGLPAPPLLNVAGPRESEAPGSQPRADAFLRALFRGSSGGSTAPPPRPVLVTGGAGYLGRHLVALAPPGRTVVATERPRSSTPAPGVERVDLADRDAVLALFERARPSLVIHTAYSLHDMERDILAATRNTADAARAVGADLVHVSSDMVLDGRSAPFDESAPPAPVHAYGRWKAAAEDYVRARHPEAAIVRASLITRFDPPDPRTEWVLSGLRGETEVALFDDELRTPILVEDLARQIWEIARLAADRRAGVWHLAGPESFSRYALGTLIAAAHGLDPRRLEPARSADAPGPRPRDLRLLTGRADRELLTRGRPLSSAAADLARRRGDIPPSTLSGRRENPDR